MSTEDDTQSTHLQKPVNRHTLGDNVPRRGSGRIVPKLASTFLKSMGWKAVGEIPNVPKLVYVALPHTSNFDGVYSIPLLLALDLDIKILGKKSLFKNPILGKFLDWAGIIPIDRGKKGSILQASIDKLKASKSMHLGLAPEGTRDYTTVLKSGFYHIAHGAGVPLLPVAMDYKTKEFRFMQLVYPSGDYEKDLEKILSQYKDVIPKHPEKLSQPLQDLIK